MFGTARAGLLPFSTQLTRTHPRTGEPWCAVLTTAVITAVPFIFSDEFAVLATGATGVIYLVYFAMMCILLKARLSGWPRRDAPMRLGRWGISLNVLALVYSGAMLVNLMWFRDATNPGWKLGIPVAIWMLAVPVLLGAAYRFVAGRRRPGAVTTSGDRSGS
jgi:amino acid transporter